MVGGGKWKQGGCEFQSIAHNDYAGVRPDEGFKPVASLSVVVFFEADNEPVQGYGGWLNEAMDGFFKPAPIGEFELDAWPGGSVEEVQIPFVL